MSYTFRRTYYWGYMKVVDFYRYIICILAMVSTAGSISAQCLGQDSLDCECLETRICNMTICVAGMNHNITIEYCQQLPVSGYIRNPCTEPFCYRPVDQVTWIKRICVPTAIQGVGAQVIYNGIIKATNLCSDTCFGATIPNCSMGSTGPCIGGGPATSLTAYCHVMAFPRCYRWVAGCLEACDGDACNQYCFAEWRYCSLNNNCVQCLVTICSDKTFTQCDQGCMKVDCTDLNTNGCAP